MDNNLCQEIVRAGLFSKKTESKPENEIIYRELVYNLSKKLEGFKLIRGIKYIDGEGLPFKNHTDKIAELKLEKNNILYTLCIEEEDLSKLDYAKDMEKEIGMAAYLYADNRILNEETSPNCFSLFISENHLFFYSHEIINKILIDEMFINRYEEEDLLNFLLVDIGNEDEMNHYFELANKASREIPFYNPTILRNKRKNAGTANYNNLQLFIIVTNGNCCEFYERKQKKFFKKDCAPAKSTISEIKDEFLEKLALAKKQKVKSI